MTTEDPTPEGNDKPGRPAAPTLIQVAFPEQPTIVFFTAIALGLIFISMPTIFRSYFAVNGMQSNLVLSIGAGLVLAAFGGQATVRIGGIIMAGAAAVTLGLFSYLQHSSHDLYLKGRIEGFDFNTYQSLGIKQDKFFVGGVVQNHNNPKQSDYVFVIFKQEIDSNTIRVELSGRNTPRERVIFVNAGDFEWAFGGSQRLVLELREENDGSDRILTLFDQSKKKTIGSEVSRGISPIAKTSILPTFINPAFAQERSAIDVPLMLKRLMAEDASTRRGARDALAQAPVESIPTIMDTFRREAANYQVKLGICVALTEMLRANKNRAAAISSKLTNDDLNQLLDAAGDPDRTVRVYAAEFLFDLGDTRTTKLAIPRAAGTSDDNARYNWLLVSQDGWRKLSAAEKAALAAPLDEAKRRSGQKTLQLFDKLQM